MNTSALILIFSAFGTAVISGSVGMVGGILLLGIMAQYFPPMELIPIHGVIQLGSNLSRIILHFSSVVWTAVIPFALGAAGGVLLGSRIVVSLPESLFQLGIGVFILLVTYFPQVPSRWAIRKGKWLTLGAVSSFLGLFFGAVGPMIGPFVLREKWKKQQMLATGACFQGLAHVFKVTTFFTLGISLSEHTGLIVAMLIAVFMGNYVGKVFIHKISDRWFRIIFRIVLTGLALRVIYLALQSSRGIA